MNDRDKTIADVNAELERLRGRIAELESRVAGDGRLEEDLRETILRQNAILSNIPDIAWLKNYVFDVSIAANSTADSHGVITQANQAFLTIWGYSGKEEVIGKKISDFLQNTDESAAIIAVLNNTGKWQGNYTARKKDGSTFTAFGLATVLKDEKGNMIGYQSSVLDITERRKAEEALRDSESRMRAIIERALFGAHSYELQPDGRLILVGANQTADHILALDHSLLIGKTIEEAFPGLVGTDIPDIYRRIAATGSTHEAENVVYERDQIHGVFAIHAFQTGPQRMTVFFRDITERKKTEEALRQSEERLRLALSAAKQGLYDLNVKTGDAVVTPEYALMLGYAPEEFIETNARWIERLHPDDRETGRRTYRSYVCGRCRNIASSFGKRQGRRLEVDFVHQDHPIRCRRGSCTECSGTHTDITDRMKAEQDAWNWSAGCSTPRSSKVSASWPEASPTTSTTC
jgi:PAS domain S-box-containing protein